MLPRRRNTRGMRRRTDDEEEAALPEIEQLVLESTRSGCERLVEADLDAPLSRLKRLLKELPAAEAAEPAESKNSPLHFAVLNRAWSAAELLLEHGFEPNPRTFDKGVPLLHLMAANGREDAIRFLVERGKVDPATRLEAGKMGFVTPREVAERTAQTEAVSVLNSYLSPKVETQPVPVPAPAAPVEAEPDIKVQADPPVSIQAFAARGDQERVKALLQEGIPVDNCCFRPGFEFIGSTAYQVAVMNEHTAVAQLLLAHKAQPNKPSFNKNVPLLHVAAAHGLDESVQFLVEVAGVDPTVTFLSEKMGVVSPEQAARAAGQADTAELLHALVDQALHSKVLQTAAHKGAAAGCYGMNFVTDSSSGAQAGDWTTREAQTGFSAYKAPVVPDSKTAAAHEQMKEVAAVETDGEKTAAEAAQQAAAEAAKQQAAEKAEAAKQAAVAAHQAAAEASKQAAAEAAKQAAVAAQQAAAEAAKHAAAEKAEAAKKAAVEAARQASADKAAAAKHAAAEAAEAAKHAAAEEAEAAKQAAAEEAAAEAAEKAASDMAAAEGAAAEAALKAASEANAEADLGKATGPAVDMVKAEDEVSLGVSGATPDRVPTNAPVSSGKKKKKQGKKAKAAAKTAESAPELVADLDALDEILDELEASSSGATTSPGASGESGGSHESGWSEICASDAKQDFFHDLDAL
eukprot:TRINITY_DN2079_c0_g1_i3.p1 TRINITY_DN2079_c0_g1~~TRINITY_DN2079_c0_g1_i3.p1  ORF type:complete len:690 (-),score=243.50 TRINITY_DN2079_c0_g1_i3:264-2333(-)